MARIIFVLTQSLDSPSGIGRYHPLAKNLARLNHEVQVFALHPDYDNLSNKEFTIDGFSVSYVSRMHVKKSGDLKSYYSGGRLLQITLDATWQLSKAVIQNKGDILIIGKPHPMNSIAGLIGRLIHGCQLFLDCDDYEAGSGRFNSSWQKSIIAWFEKWVPKRVNTVLTNTFFMRENLINWGVNPEKIYYLSNGVEASRFPTPSRDELEALQREYGFEDKKIAGYIGSMSLPSHPVNLFIEAIRILGESNPDLDFLIVGGGEDLPKLKAQANKLNLSNSIRFTGRIPPDQISLYYSLLDVSVDPVFDDDAARGRSPLKLFESWFCGVPFVTSDVGDRRALIGDPPAGVLVTPGDPNALVQGILKVIQNQEKAEKLRSEGIERVKSYTWEHLANDFNQVIQSSLEVSRNG